MSTYGAESGDEGGVVGVVDAAEICSAALENRGQPGGNGRRRPGEDGDFPVRGEG